MYLINIGWWNFSPNDISVEMMNSDQPEIVTGLDWRMTLILYKEEMTPVFD